MFHFQLSISWLGRFEFNMSRRPHHDGRYVLSFDGLNVDVVVTVVFEESDYRILCPGIEPSPAYWIGPPSSTRWTELILIHCVLQHGPAGVDKSAQIKLKCLLTGVSACT